MAHGRDSQKKAGESLAFFFDTAFFLRKPLFQNSCELYKAEHDLQFNG
jgi:hypothetical protein